MGEYYSACYLDDGSLLEGRILANGNMLISASKDGAVISSTETDYANSVFIYRAYDDDKSFSIEKRVPMRQ